MSEKLIKALGEQIDQLGEAVEVSVKNAKTEINKSVGEQIEGVKSAITKDVSEVKEIAEKAAKKAEENDTLVTEAKNAAQQVQVKFDELDKKLSTSKMFQQESKESFGDVLGKAIEEKTDDLNKFIKGETKRVAIELKGFDQKAVADFSTANVTGGSVYGAVYRPGIIMNQNTATHVRQLLTVSPADAGTDYYFMKESGAGEGSIAPTSEKQAAAATTQATGLKPQFDLDLIEASVKFETIAGWMGLSKKSIKNIKGLISFLQKRVPEKLMDVEDAQILYGDGTSPNIKGILTAGNFTAGSAAGATALVEKIINDLSSFEDTYKRVATGIAMRPADFYSFFKNKASGSGEYDLPQGVTFINGVLYILGVPVAKTTALTANDYVVGDWVNGAELLVQDAMKIEFFEQDGTNVRTNQVTLRVEETIALPVFGGDYFLKGSSAAA